MIHIVLGIFKGAGLAGFLISMLMMVWHAVQIAGLGHAGLLINGFRLLDRRQHTPEVRPHISGMWRWFGIAAAFFVLFGIGLIPR